jgi:hypothetical protein
LCSQGKTKESGINSKRKLHGVPLTSVNKLKEHNIAAEEGYIHTQRQDTLLMKLFYNRTEHAEVSHKPMRYAAAVAARDDTEV